MMFMLDTDICIYTVNRKPPDLRQRFETIEPGMLVMSAITFAELANGAKKSLQVDRNLRRLQALSELIAVLPFDKAAAITYGDIRSDLERKGTPIGSNDMLIAAHALSLGLALVTNNEKEFCRVEGLRIENWATSSPRA